MTKQEDLKVCWDAEKIIYIFEFCTVLPNLSVMSHCESVTQMLNCVVWAIKWVGILFLTSS